jgi:hypothetical protein
VAKKNNAPSKAELQETAARLSPGERATVGTGITLTKDSTGRLRFQWRERLGGRGTRWASGTCDSYEEAEDERDDFLARKNDSSAKRLERGRKSRSRRSSPTTGGSTSLTLEGNTVLEYSSAWDKDIYPYFKGMTLAGLLEFENWDDWDEWLRKGHKKRDGSLAKSAIEKAYNIFGRLLNYALEEELIPYNPLEAWQKKRRRRDREARKKASKAETTRPVRRSEIPTPRQVELARLWIPGRYPLERQARRALITLLAWVGLRPGEALYLRWLHLRDAFGPLGYIAVHGV